jgi:hypothetical protein
MSVDIGHVVYIYWKSALYTKYVYVIFFVVFFMLLFFHDRTYKWLNQVQVHRA